MRDVAADVATLLAASELGLMLGTNLFIGRMPETPDACVAVLETGGPEADRYTGSPQKAYRRNTFVVRVRGSPEATYVASVLARACHAVLDGRTDVTPYVALRATDNPMEGPPDGNARPFHSFNAVAEYRELPSGAPPAVVLPGLVRPIVTWSPLIVPTSGAGAVTLAGQSGFAALRTVAHSQAFAGSRQSVRIAFTLSPSSSVTVLYLRLRYGGAVAQWQGVAIPEVPFHWYFGDGVYMAFAYEWMVDGAVGAGAVSVVLEWRLGFGTGPVAVAGGCYFNVVIEEKP